jgi:hypothetical protein
MNDAWFDGLLPDWGGHGVCPIRCRGNLGRGPRWMQDRLEAISGAKTERDLLIDR